MNLCSNVNNMFESNMDFQIIAVRDTFLLRPVDIKNSDLAKSFKSSEKQELLAYVKKNNINIVNRKSFTWL